MNFVILTFHVSLMVQLRWCNLRKSLM